MVVSPTKPGSGVKVTLPNSSTSKLPCSGTAKVFCMPSVLGSRSTVEGSMLPSSSVSLSTTFKVTGTSTSLIALSSLATGGTFTTSTVMFAGSESWLLLSARV